MRSGNIDTVKVDDVEFKFYHGRWIGIVDGSMIQLSPHLLIYNNFDDVARR